MLLFSDHLHSYTRAVRVIRVAMHLRVGNFTIAWMVDDTALKSLIPVRPRMIFGSSCSPENPSNSVREGVEEMIKKKKRVGKDLGPQGSGSVGTHLSTTPSDSVALVTSLEALNDVNEGAGKKINSFPREVAAGFLPDHDVLPSPGENAYRGLSDVYPSHSADAEDSGLMERERD
ncbi:hypothetical protein Tco_0562693 [Tanacetum coccineum]